jgi:hypothetical protein
MDRILEFIIQRINFTTSTWDNYYKETFEYNDKNNQIEQLKQFWNEDSIKWINDSKFTNDYNAIGDIIASDSYYNWTSSFNYYNHHYRNEYICAQLVDNHDIQNSTHIGIYPNPTFSNFINVNLHHASTFEFLDLTGHILKKGVFNVGTNTLLLEKHITNGLYFLKIDGVGYKVVVER